jgi:mRNA interferase HigB
MDRIYAKSTLREFWEKFPDCEQYLKTWYDTAMNSDWKSPSDIKQSYANASILKENRIVFNIKGKSYRLVTKFNFEKQWIFIRFIGSHSEYDKIDANTV